MKGDSQDIQELLPFSLWLVYKSTRRLSILTYTDLAQRTTQYDTENPKTRGYCWVRDASGRQGNTVELAEGSWT
jgi:hypothetical protein